MNYPLNKRGILSLREMIRRRVTKLQRELACAAADYLLHFGYHAFFESGPDGMNGPGWSAYYAANWNCSIGNVDRSVIVPERDPFKEERGSYLADLYNKLDSMGAFNKSKYGDTLHVTNSVYYGKWLNDGGEEFLTFRTRSNPNRFIELCQAYLHDNLNDLIRVAREEK